MDVIMSMSELDSVRFNLGNYRWQLLRRGGRTLILIVHSYVVDDDYIYAGLEKFIIADFANWQLDVSILPVV